GRGGGRRRVGGCRGRPGSSLRPGKRAGTRLNRFARGRGVRARGVARNGSHPPGWTVGTTGWGRTGYVPPLRIGYKASAEQFGPRELVEYAVRAEQDGLDSVWVSDHYQPWRHTGGHAPFSLAFMTAVGERTERVVLGTSVLTATFRYNPAVIAQAFATMACLYPDRIVLGLGTGEALNETAVTGAEWPDFKGRFARLREAVRLMRQ